MLYNRTTDEWPKRCTDGEDGEDHAHEVPALSQRQHVTDNHINHHIDTTATNALNCSPGNHHRRINCTAADAAANDEQYHRANH